MVWSLGSDFKVVGDKGFYLPVGHSIKFEALPGTLLDPDNSGCSSVKITPGTYVPDAEDDNGVLLSTHLIRNGRRMYMVRSISGSTGVPGVDEYFFPVYSMFPGATHTGTLKINADSECQDGKQFTSRPLKLVGGPTGMVIDPVDKVYYSEDTTLPPPVGFQETAVVERAWSEGSTVRTIGGRVKVSKRATGLLTFDMDCNKVSFPGLFESVMETHKKQERFEVPREIELLDHEDALKWWVDA